MLSDLEAMLTSILVMIGNRLGRLDTVCAAVGLAIPGCVLAGVDRH